MALARERASVHWKSDDWLARILGMPCFRPVSRVSAEERSILHPALPGFYSIKTPTSNHRLAAELFKARFTVMDLHIELESEIDGALVSRASSQAKVAIARASQLEALQAISVAAFGESRFHRDGRIAPARADEVWRKWVADAMDDDQRIVLSAERDGAPVGFISLRKQNDGTTSIDLLASAASARRTGVGEALLAAAADSSGTIVCETETWNTQALNFYGRHGFRTGALYSVFHHHHS